MSQAIDATGMLPAATILLLRAEPEFEVLMVLRHHEIDFIPGATVFPGGKTHGGDDDAPGRNIAWAGTTSTASSGRCVSRRSVKRSKRRGS
jgi:8-oxo-dGTP pyrophosphatase MutT (NUDIX family)